MGTATHGTLAAANRKAEARQHLSMSLDIEGLTDRMRLADAYARACIAEAVAPALEYIDNIGQDQVSLERTVDIVNELRRLLTEGRE